MAYISCVSVLTMVPVREGGALTALDINMASNICDTVDTDFIVCRAIDELRFL